MPTDMILNILNLIATSVLAYAAIRIAGQANRIANRSVRVEVDKHIFDWAQRCLNCFSRISSLRLTHHEQIEEDQFRKERRELRSQLYALYEEGSLFFEREQAQESEASLEAIMDVINCIKGDTFEPPKAGDYETTRKGQNNEIRTHVRRFIASVQTRVGNEWLLGV